MTKVRSEYIKKLMTESNNLEEKLKDIAQSTINSILEEKTNKNLRQILAEDENSFSEEEVEDEPTPEIPAETEEEGTKEDGAEPAEDETDGEWDDLEKFKDEDGEYDLRSMDKDELVKVLKAMGPEDAVRIVKNEDDSLTVTDEDTEEEYELELDGEDSEQEGDEISVEEPEEIEIDTFGSNGDGEDGEGDDNVEGGDEFEIELDEENLGYTDNYQKKTAMTTPDNNEPADPKSTYSMDGGVPKGTEKPWVGPKKKAPFDNNVSESAEDECGNGICECGTEAPEQPIDEAGEFGKVAARVSGKQRRNNSSCNGGKPYGARHNSVSGEYKDVETGLSESIKKKANEIFRENKQLKELMGKLQNQVNEAIVVNQSLANVIKIINENSTTVNEKKDIIRRFNECTTREESNKLYATISEELKRDGKTHSAITESINSQISESREKAVETQMYQSQDLSDTLSFMARLDAIR